MKLTDTEQICPYTGLRSFTEEESLYFKGRDEQVDQVTAQLEERKFLMLTGASGEGKSSLIYAGLIPNARAGFFKARFANWTVVDFRPERSPVKSMAKALAEKFSIHPETVETEMRRGFSSLTDLYLNSDFYIDYKDPIWEGLSDDDKKAKKRKASNLLVLIDQFEEFFTNPENYYNDNPSQDAQVVVNLILETSRIALQQKLPIYIVCTMRSDYIGQCSSFRGLPEYIGFSQFFVPRLKRKELKQVVEEPALLSGNKISQRLMERLVYDLAEGVDQLPILQHALSQIWLMADRGTEEMDLIHYAMVGGMPSSELPTEDTDRFNAWLGKQPAYQQKFLLETGLHKVIENHASRLYESAAETYNASYPETPISTKETKNIIALTFSCLTKIDNSRAVRNRMTLHEIAAIINRPAVSADVVGKVLNIFRAEGNSFIRPFETEDESTHALDVDAVLDITHESLIRNWGMLHKWASQEFEYYSTFLDLKKQLDRWKESGKRTGYLLPIGPLSYFENWNTKCNPNAAWINRYAERNEDAVAGWRNAEQVLHDVHEFLRRSARHVMISRAFLKYGAQRIAIFFSAAILIVLCGFYWFDAEKKKNANVIEQVQQEAGLLLASREVASYEKAIYLVTQERFSTGSMMAYLKSLDDSKDRISLSIDTYLQLLIFDKKFRAPIKLELINDISSQLGANVISDDPEFKLIQLNKFITQLAYDAYYNPSAELETNLANTASSLYDLLLVFYKNDQLYKVSTSIGLNQAIHHWLTFGHATAGQIDSLLELISPLYSDQARSMFTLYYPKGSYEPNGIRASDFNGGYHSLASLYAAAGEQDKLIWCFDQLRAQPDYFTDKLFNNYGNVIGYLYQYGHQAMVPAIVKQIKTINPANTPDVVYRNLILRSGYQSHLVRVNFRIKRGNLEDGNYYLNLSSASREQYNAMVADYEQYVSNINSRSDRNFLMAMHYKRLAVFMHKYHYDRGLSVPQQRIDELLDKAWSYFLQTDPIDMQQQVSITYSYTGETRSQNLTRRQLFVYPDYMGSAYCLRYHSDVFFRYLEKRHLLEQAFTNLDDINQIHYWISNMFEQQPYAIIQTMYDGYETSDTTIVQALNFATSQPFARDFDANLLVLVLANHAFERGDSLTGVAFFRRFNQQDITKSGDRYQTWQRTFFYNQLMGLAKNLALIGRHAEALALISRLPTKTERLITFNYVADKLYDHDYDPQSFNYLDRAVSEWETDDESRIPGYLDYRNKILFVLEKIGGEKMAVISNRIFRNIQEGRKFDGTASMVEGATERLDFYNATQLIPSTLTEQEDLICRQIILLAAAREKEGTESTIWRAMDRYMGWDEYMMFFGFQ